MANGQPMPAEGAPQQGGDASTLPGDVLVAMNAIGSELQQMGAPEEILQMMQQSIQLYAQVLDAMSGQGGGGNQPNAVPVQQEGAIAGPA